MTKEAPFFLLTKGAGGCKMERWPVIEDECINHNLGEVWFYMTCWDRW
jgi:hypothetical protein